MSNQVIAPKILKGTRDFLPKDMAKRNFVMDKIVGVFKNFGYDTIETPVIEYSEIILGKYGDEGNKLVYSFEDNGGRKVALRYDQTVPFARLIAQYAQELPMPFKRYQISRVWRADKPAKGRYREFYQCDIDIIGTENLVAEGEVSCVISQVYKKLGFEKFIIKVNSRRLINSILEDIGVEEEKYTDVLRLLDKLDRIGFDGVEVELNKIISGDKVKQIMIVIRFLGTNSEKVEFLKKYNTQEIEEFLQLAKSFGVEDENIEFDVSLARGLDYYTGIIFEVVIPGIQLGSVCGGGRYDDLCSTFCKQKYSGVGVAFGFDRMLVAMEELNLLKEIDLNSQVLVTYFNNDTLENSIQILRDIQKSGVSAEMYFESSKLQKQFKYADKKGIPFVVVCGPDDVEKGEVVVKIMKTGKQKMLPQNQIGSYFKNYI